MEVAVANRTRGLAVLRERAEHAMELAVASKRPEPRLLYVRLMEEVDAEEAAIALLGEELVAARGTVSPEEHARRIKGLRSDLSSDYEDGRHAARIKVTGALHELVTAMTFERPTRLVGLELGSGAYVVVHPYGDGITAGYDADRG